MSNPEISALFDNYDEKKLREDLCAGGRIKESELLLLCDKVCEILAREPNVLYLDPPVTVVGDIHGQIYDMFNLFDKHEEKLGSNENEKFLFLGDYVDRGYQSVETFVYLMYLKVKYPQKVWLLRGNHESRQVNQMYGLFNDCLNVYGHNGIWYRLNEVFDYLPVAAVVKPNIFCVHGGLSPRVTLIEQLTMLNRFKDLDEGPICDLAWSDPDDTCQKFRANMRGAGFSFGANQTKVFLQNNKLLNDHLDGDDAYSDHGFVARSHQLAQEGYQWLHEKRLVIVWSAPNYTYRQNNKATFMYVPGDQQKIGFHEFLPHEQSPVKPIDQTIEYFA